MINKIIRYLTSNPRASPSEVSAKPLEWPVNPDGAQVSPPNEADLIKLDRCYEGMYGLHRSIHLGLAKELVDLRVREGLSTLLEVAAGTGWNATKLINGGFDYWALDLSETATAVAMRRHPEGKFINASIDEAGVIRDGAFDVVFCASMLEHLRDPERALRHLVRIARRHVFVIFFEGLADAGQDQIAQYPFTNPDYLVFGTKFAKLQKEWGGYFWNRYTRQTIQRVCRETGPTSIEFLDASNRSYIKGETILRVRK